MKKVPPQQRTNSSKMKQKIFRQKSKANECKTFLTGNSQHIRAYYAPFSITLHYLGYVSQQKLF